MPTVGITDMLELRRIEVGADYVFVRRCRSGAYGPLVRAVAIDVLDRASGIDGADPLGTATATAIAIIDDVRETEQNVLPLAA